MAATDQFRLLLADLILILHFSFVLFVVGGFVCIVAGRFIGWCWIYRAAFRFAHLAAIGYVVLQSWLGRLCPLTIWENALRAAAGQPAYEQTFIEYWLHRWLFYEADFWIFVLLYSLFGAGVLGALAIDRYRLVRSSGAPMFCDADNDD